ncbi:MAG: 3-dehydroquinate synthase [Anaerolineae bacterium]
MARILTVRTPDFGLYNILVGQGGLAMLHEMNDGQSTSAPRAVVVTNTKLAPLYGEKLVASLPDARLVVIPDGEQYKTLDTVSTLYRAFIEADLPRDGVVFALGGGVVGDTAGYAAATYLRGVSLVQVPTSLLAMVDSSVGGKVGVDLPEGKNLIGAFKQPQMVMIDIDVLATLPEREWRCGMAEVLKHGLLVDETLLDPAITEDREEMIYRAIKVKVDIVQKDPYEQDIRAHLNLGHTFGHAIERVSGYVVPHGEAVAMGLMAAALLSARLGLADETLPPLVETILLRNGLPVRIGGYEPEEIYEAMGTDKKRKKSGLRFVLLRGVGQPLIVPDVPKEEVLAVLQELQGLS